MRIKCYLIKLKELRDISPKAYLAICFDGRESVVPKSQMFGFGPEGRSDSYWIAAWIVEKKNLQHSPDRFGWYDSEKPRTPGTVFKKVERKIPVKRQPVNITADTELLR